MDVRSRTTLLDRGTGAPRVAFADLKSVVIRVDPLSAGGDSWTVLAESTERVVNSESPPIPDVTGFGGRTRVMRTTQRNSEDTSATQILQKRNKELQNLPVELFIYVVKCSSAS